MEELKTSQRRIPPAAFSNGVRGKNCPEEWEIASVVREEAPPGQVEKIGRHLSDCSFCLDLAAAFQKVSAEEREVVVPERWKADAVRRMSVAGRASRRKSFWSRFMDGVGDLLPSWNPASAFAAGAFALALMVVVGLWMTRGGEVSIVPGTEMMASFPAESDGVLGFMDVPPKQDQVSRMKVAVNGGEVHFEWPPVDKVSSYAFSLIELPSGRSVLPVFKVDGTTTKVPSGLIQPGTRYGFKVAGRAVDGSRHEHTGEISRGR